MRLSRRAVCAMVMGSVLVGCTMMVQESTQPMEVRSSPTGAIVSVDGRLQSDVTPMTVTLDPRRTHELRVEKTCYATYTRVIEPSLGKRQLFLSVYDLVNQLPPTVHVDLTPTCAAGSTS